MINSAHAKDNGAYTQYQREHQQHQPVQTYVPEAFDPSDGELTNMEICAYAFVVLFALIMIYKAFTGGSKS